MRPKLNFVPTHTVIFDGEKGEGTKVVITIPDNGTGYCRVGFPYKDGRQMEYSICETARLAPIAERNRLFRESLSPLQRAALDRTLQRIAEYQAEQGVSPA